MEHQRFGNTVIVRMDPGEEVLEQMEIAAREEGIRLGSVSAIGAVNDFTVGLYDLEAKQYFKNRFTGAYEIVSLLGNITTRDGEYYAHLHMSAADGEGKMFGGHLNRAVISVTCEMFITVLDGSVNRVPDDTTGINIIKF